MKILLFIFLLANSLLANITIEQDVKKLHNFEIESFYDKSKKLTIENIRKKEFIKTPSQFTFGHKRGNFWFKFKITNKSQKEKFILYFNEPYYEHLNLYSKENNLWKEDRNGVYVPLEERSTKYYNPTFELNIKPFESKTYYIKGNSKLTTSSEFEIYEKEYFNSYGKLYDLIYMLYFGALLFISILSLFIYFRLKELVYLYYSGYVFFCVLWMASYSGLIFYTTINNFFHKFLMVTPMWIMFLVLFSSEFLSVKKHLPKIYKPLNIFAYIFGIFAILITFSFEPWFEIMNLFASIVFTVLFTVAIIILRKQNDKNTKYYLLIMSIYMITMTLMSAMANGWIENNDINRYSFLYGSFFEILFFTLLLTNRFYIFQNEKLSIQKELIELKNKNEVILEQKIRDRTKQINKAYKEVKDLSQERELLLKEIYHRVKNNFHSIIGLLHIEKKSNSSTQTKEILLRTINRIKSMSIIHEFLYQSKSFSKVDTKEYLDKVIFEIERTYSKNNIIINKHIDDGIFISMDKAMALSMVTNEVISNSIKHYKKDSKCIIDINLKQKDNYIEFSIQDNGQGFEYKEVKKNLGLKLIEQFSKKLNNSNYSFINNSGTKFILEFEYLEN